MKGMTTLHSIVSGNESSEKTVVLLPSIGTTHEAWEPQLPALEDTYRVVRIDHRGHGGSPTPAIDLGMTSVDDLAQDVLETLNSLGIERCTVVGLSMGGAVAQYLAATSDRIERAVFASTATFLGGAGKWQERSDTARTSGMDSIVDPTVDNWFTEGFKEREVGVVDKFKAMVGSVDPEAYAQCGDALAKWGFDERLQEITVPVLTIAGADDPSTGPKQHQEIAAGVTGEAECVVIDDASHQVGTEQPDKFNEALLAFLEK